MMNATDTLKATFQGLANWLGEGDKAGKEI